MTTRAKNSIKPPSTTANESSTAKKTLPLWCVREVAEFLRLRPRGVYAMAERGSLPSIKVGSRLRFDRSDIVEWVKRHRRMP